MTPGDRVRVAGLDPDPFDANGRAGVVVDCHPNAGQVRVDLGGHGVVDVPAECVVTVPSENVEAAAVEDVQPAEPLKPFVRLTIEGEWTLPLEYEENGIGGVFPDGAPANWTTADVIKAVQSVGSVDRLISEWCLGFDLVADVEVVWPAEGSVRDWRRETGRVFQ